MRIDTTPERTLELLEEAVNARGADFVYPEEWKDNGSGLGMCKYVHDGKPACIVGWVVHAYGVPVEAMRTFEGHDSHEITRAMGFDYQSGRMLSIAQSVQDSGQTWGTALARARDV